MNVSKVWLLQDGQEILVSAKEIALGDSVVVRMGNVIPFDGVIRQGEAMVNQASMTGESLPVRKEVGTYVYAGTVVEEGEIVLQVREMSGSTQALEKIVTMIEDSGKAEIHSGKAEQSIWRTDWFRIPCWGQDWFMR